MLKNDPPKEEGTGIHCRERRSRNRSVCQSMAQSKNSFGPSASIYSIKFLTVAALCFSRCRRWSTLLASKIDNSTKKYDEVSVSCNAGECGNRVDAGGRTRCQGSNNSDETDAFETCRQAAYFRNRAAAQLKLGEFRAALEDAKKARPRGQMACWLGRLRTVISHLR